jgi:hypothetical protein
MFYTDGKFRTHTDDPVHTHVPFKRKHRETALRWPLKW